MKKFLIFAIIIIGALSYCVMQVNKTLHTPVKIGEDVIALVPHGAGLNKIADTLESHNLILNKPYFIAYAKLIRAYPKIKAGEYLINRDVSSIELLNILMSGKLYARRITFYEGITADEISKKLKHNDMLSGDISDLKEGEFLPETYTFFRSENREKILNQGKTAMQNFLQQAWNSRDKNIPLKNKEEMLVLASIVEKETSISKERPVIASVFMNRLRKNMLLQTDPTVIYALTKGKTELNRNLTKADFTVDSPYNTYKYAGLPPAPICSPGKASIMAVAHPAETNYLYFVASGNGGHNFASTLSEHNKNVQKWRKINSKKSKQ